MKFALPIIALSLLVSSCSNKPATEAPKAAPSWEIDFFDDFNTFNSDNWQDQILWVNNEDQCYVPNNEYGTREVSNGTIKIKVVDIGEKRPCTNTDKTGKQHHDTQYVAGNIPDLLLPTTLKRAVHLPLTNSWRFLVAMRPATYCVS